MSFALVSDVLISEAMVSYAFVPYLRNYVLDFDVIGISIRRIGTLDSGIKGIGPIPTY